MAQSATWFGREIVVGTAEIQFAVFATSCQHPEIEIELRQCHTPCLCMPPSTTTLLSQCRTGIAAQVCS